MITLSVFLFVYIDIGGTRCCDTVGVIRDGVIDGEKGAGESLTSPGLVLCDVVLSVPEDISSSDPCSCLMLAEGGSSRLCMWVDVSACEVPVLAVVLFRFVPRIIRSLELALHRWCKEDVLEDWIS